MKIDLHISEEDGIRYLHFGSEWIQGAMKIRAPYTLVLDYTNDLMVWEGCVDLPPAHIVTLGLGAGSVAKYCLKNYPKSRLTAIEIAPQVCVAAHRFFKLPATDDRFEIEIIDAAKWVRAKAHHGSCDVMIIDLYDADAFGPVHDSVAFYRDCKRCLRPGGAITVNVFGAGFGFEDSFAHVFEAFDGAAEALAPCAAGNRIILARV